MMAHLPGSVQALQLKASYITVMLHTRWSE
jgi:hypothetical protein